MINSLNFLIVTIIIHLSLIDFSTVCVETLEETGFPLLETATNDYTTLVKTEYIPRLLDLEYYTSSDFDVAIHLDPRLDPGLNLSLNVVQIPDSSLYPSILTQDILEAEVDEVVDFCNTQKQSFLDMRNMGINHPFVDANIRLAEATLSQIDAAQEVHTHKVSFLETYILPERWEHYMNN